MKSIPSRQLEAGIFLALLVAALFFSWRMNFPGGKPRGVSEFFADKAAYYVYLPATFIYGWDVTRFPEKIDEKTRGFTLHRKNDRLIIKTTYGVALMLSPFFIPAHILATATARPADGFSPFYQKMMVIPPLIYLCLGLFFLRRFLRYYFREGISWTVVLFLFFGTNLFFYSVDEGLMSHVYSFFLISAALLLMKRFIEGNFKSYRTFLLLAFVLALLALIRPTNLVALSLLAFLDAGSRKEVLKRLRMFIQPKYSLAFIVMLLLVYFPQMIYWHYLSGQWLYNSYPGEGFTNLAHPMILPLWFAPLNGFFLYTPMALFFVTGMVIMIRKKAPNGFFCLFFFLFISLVFASWHTWFFGGSLGMRPFIDFYPLLALPFGYSVQWFTSRKNIFYPAVFALFLFIFSYYNLRLSWHYNFFPGSVWSWDEYKQYLTNTGFQHFDRKKYTYINDFENNTLPDAIPRIKSPFHSPTLSTCLDETMEFNAKCSWQFDQILVNLPGSAEMSVWIRPDNEGSTGARLVCSIEDINMKNIFYRTVVLDEVGLQPGKWTKAEATIHFPEWIPPSSVVSFYLWNMKRTRFYADDLIIKFRPDP